MGAGTDTVRLSEESITDLADALRGGGGSYGGGGGGGGNTQLKRSLITVGDSLEGLAGSLNNGTQGMSAYNGVIGSSTAVFQQFITPLGKFGDVVGKIVGVGTDYIQQVNKQTDALAKSYQDISGVGAAGKDGLQGVFTTMQQFGLGIADLPKFNALIRENADSLAKLGGTVGQGVKTFANMSEGIQRTGLQTELFALGQTTESINKGLGNFTKSIIQAGGSTRLLTMSTEQQAKAASDYIKQADLLTKLTGQSVEQQQKTIDQAMANDRYAARAIGLQKELREAEAMEAGAARDQRIAEIKATQKQDEAALKIAAAQGPEVFAGVQDMLAGAVTDASNKVRFAFGNEFQEAVTRVPKTIDEANQNVAGAFTIAGKNFETYVDTFGRSISLSGTNIGVKLAEGATLIGRDFAKDLTSTIKEQTAQIEKPERALATYNAMLQAQTDVTRGFQNLILLGMTPVTNAMSIASTAIKTAIELIPGSGTARPAGSSQAYITEKEQTERGRTETLAARNKVAPVIPDDVKEKIRKDLREDIESLQKWLGDTVTGLTTRIPSLNQAGTALADSAKSAGNAVSGAVDSVVDQFNRMRNRLNEMAPSLRTPTSGQTAALPSGQVAALSMTSLLSEMRNLGGPNNNYNPSLNNAVYTPPINREDETARSNAVGAAEQYNREQVMAYNTMSGKLDEMIDLLSRSVGIQDKTLRAAYSA